MLPQPRSKRISNLFNITWPVRADVMQLIGRNFVIEMNRPIPISRERPQHVRCVSCYDTLLMQTARDLFVLADSNAKSFGENMSSKIKEGFESATQA